jgi:hypothetical protein
MKFDSSISAARSIPAADNRSCLFLLSVILNPIAMYRFIRRKSLTEMPIDDSSFLFTM